MNRSFLPKHFPAWLLSLAAAVALLASAALAASTEISGDTTAKPGDTVTITVSYTGSDTVAVGLIYTYNSVIDSVTASNSSPWGDSKQDTDLNQIGVGDYKGYDSGNWNYILNGTAEVVTFRVHISENASVGDVAKFRLKTAYYATTENNLDEVMNQDLPTASLSSFAITVVGDATPTPTAEPEKTPTAEPTGTKEATKAPTAAENTPTATPTPTAAANTPTAAETSGETGNMADDFIDRTPIVPGDVVDTIDEDYHDSATDSFVVCATRDDAGKTILYEIGTLADGTIIYRKSVTTEAGDTTVTELTEEQFSAEVLATENYLADRDDPSKYAEEETGTEDGGASSPETGDTEEIETELSPAPTGTGDKAASGSEDGSTNSGRIVYGILGIVIVILVLVFFLVIRRFKEGKHRNRGEESPEK